MVWVNSIAIIALFVLAVLQRREIEALHKRLQTAQERQGRLQAEDLKLAERTLDLANAHKSLEKAYTALRDTTTSALNIFEQQILRGAREDLEALDGTLEDGEAEEQSADTGAGAVRN